MLRYVLIFLIDLTAAACAFMAAYLTSHGYPWALNVPALEEKLAGFALAAAFAFAVFSPYRVSWRYVSTPDLVTILKSALLAVAVYTIGAFLLTRGDNVPRSVPVLTLIYMTVAMVGMRISYRLALEYSRRLPKTSGARRAAGHPILLCGLSDKAESFIRASRRRPGSTFWVAGIIDDSRINLGRTVQGVTVLGSLKDLKAVLEKLHGQGIDVKELIVTEPSPSRKRLMHILTQASSYGMKVLQIPGVTDMEAVTSKNILEPRPIELSDLLLRSEVNIKPDEAISLIRDRVVLTTGAGGSIGSELCRQIAAFAPRRLIITDSSEFLLYTIDTELRDKYPDLDIVTRIVDVRDAERVARIFSRIEPDIVFHAAALKHVPLTEDNPLEAIKTNVLGTRNVADAARASGVSSFVLISTDKAVNPSSIMGATKRAAEAYCQALDMICDKTRFKTVRFGNVLGSSGSVTLLFQNQIAAGGPVTVTHPDIVRYFMTIPEAISLILYASAHSDLHKTGRGKVIVLDMGEPVRIVDLAERMIQLAGLKPYVDIDIVFTRLRPGEKLHEELFHAHEVREGHTEEGYVVASPRVIEWHLLNRTFDEIAACAAREDRARAIALLSHAIPETRNGATTPAAPASLPAKKAETPRGS
ncbi:MAG: polysaccharide biosynthesis protein [Aquamicrobium sp.]|uniref:polysaccharide biosynthesis protein n=1 Tax=Aquamicrobium sp. TaxID=1872579 RepID=UPI00349E7C24|nr:polysaccharide biosynthesis protein [Aquamicrobium sp.]